MNTWATNVMIHTVWLRFHGNGAKTPVRILNVIKVFTSLKYVTKIRMFHVLI